MVRFNSLRIIALFSVFFLGGCASLNFNAMIQPNSVTSHSCTEEQKGIVTTQLRAPAPAPITFAYLLPPAVVNMNEKKNLMTWEPQEVGKFARPKYSTAVTNLTDYSRLIEAATQEALPKGLSDDPVVTAFRRALTKASAQSQVAAAIAAKITNAQDEAAKLEQYHVPTSVNTSQVKAFANALVVSLLRPTIAAPSSSALDQNQNVFAKYFSDFYDGQFVDRFGQTIAKPNLSLPNLAAVNGPIKISMSLSDADIGAALTVLIEYLADLIDPTPVLGSDPYDKIDKKTTTFYPGGNNSKPTALAAGMANYKQISNDCGVTTTNAKILLYVANAAGDEAQLVNGLVTQSVGGIGISLGAFGKISIGDNQVLGTIVKAVASRAAMRISLASSYWALESAGRRNTVAVTEGMPGPNRTKGNALGPEPGDLNGYLRFGL